MPVSRPIQPLAPGFLNLLGLKNLGQLPAGLIDEVRPGVEMTPWYLNGSELIQSATDSWLVAAGELSGFWQIGSNPITGQNPITVPDGELWWVEDMDVRFGVIAPSDPLTVVTSNIAQASAAAELPPSYAAVAFPVNHVVHKATEFTGFGPTVALTNPIVFRLASCGKFFAPAGTRFGLVAGQISVFDGTPALLDLGFDLSIRYTPLKA